MSHDPSSTLVAVAFCPHPPLLLPLVEAAPDVATDQLRVACGEALQTVLGLRPDVVLVVGDGPAGVRYGTGDAADLAAYGATGRLPFAGRVRPGGRTLPLAHAVGARLLDLAGHDGLRLGVAPGDLADALTGLPGPVGILAVAGPEHAPAAFHAAVAAALRDGDPVALARVGAAEGERPPGAGAGTWRAVGTALAGRAVTARLLLDTGPALDAVPPGAGHLVADWVLAEVPDGVPGWLQR